MNSAIHYATAAQRNADVIREARRQPPARPPRPPAEPAAAPGLVAALTRRLTRPHALWTVPNRR